MNVFKSHIKGFRCGGRSCPCCVESHSKQLTRRRARHRLKQADRVDLINAVDEEEEEEDLLHNDDLFIDDYWDDLFWLDELYLWSKYKAA